MVIGYFNGFHIFEIIPVRGRSTVDYLHGPEAGHGLLTPLPDVQVMEGNYREPPVLGIF